MTQFSNGMDVLVLALWVSCSFCPALSALSCFVLALSLLFPCSFDSSQGIAKAMGVLLFSFLSKNRVSSGAIRANMGGAFRVISKGVFCGIVLTLI